MKNTDTTNKRGKITGMLGAGIGFIIAYLLIQHFIFPSTDQALKDIASKLNKSYPVMVDEYTRIDSVTIPLSKTIQYNYTLVNLDKESLSPDSIRENLKSSIINEVKSNPQMKSLRDKGVTFIYYYYDQNGEFAYQLSVTPEIYKSKQ